MKELLSFSLSLALPMFSLSNRQCLISIILSGCALDEVISPSLTINFRSSRELSYQNLLSLSKTLKVILANRLMINDNIFLN